MLYVKTVIHIDTIVGSFSFLYFVNEVLYYIIVNIYSFILNNVSIYEIIYQETFYISANKLYMYRLTNYTTSFVN